MIDGEQYQKEVNVKATHWLESPLDMVTDLQELVERIEREVVTGSSSTQWDLIDENNELVLRCSLWLRKACDIAWTVKQQNPSIPFNIVRLRSFDESLRSGNVSESFSQLKSEFETFKVWMRTDRDIRLDAGQFAQVFATAPSRIVSVLGTIRDILVGATESEDWPDGRHQFKVTNPYDLVERLQIYFPRFLKGIRLAAENNETVSELLDAYAEQLAEIGDAIGLFPEKESFVLSCCPTDLVRRVESSLRALQDKLDVKGRSGKIVTVCGKEFSQFDLEKSFTEEARLPGEWCKIISAQHGGTVPSTATFQNRIQDKKGNLLRAVAIGGQRYRLHIDDLPDRTKSKPLRDRIIDGEPKVN